MTTWQDPMQIYRYEKHEKNPWRSVTFSTVAGFKVILFHVCFSRFLNCANHAKSRKASQISVQWFVILLTTHLTHFIQLVALFTLIPSEKQKFYDVQKKISGMKWVKANTLYTETSQQLFPVQLKWLNSMTRR